MVVEEMVEVEVEMMVMESLDPTLLQMKTEVNDRSDVTHDRPRVRLS